MRIGSLFLRKYGGGMHGSDRGRGEDGYSRVGASSPGRMKVVLLGPKLKKNWHRT